jgi:hypothetical protein
LVALGVIGESGESQSGRTTGRQSDG